MNPDLTRDLVADRHRRFLVEAERARLAAEARSTTTERQTPHAAIRAVGRLLVALGCRLGGAIPPAAEPARSATEGRFAQ